MLNIGTKKEALKIHEAAVKKYNDTHSQMTKSCEALYLRRKESVAIIEDIEALINSIANSPKDFSTTMSSVATERLLFRQTEEYAKEAYRAAIKAEGGAAAAVAGGTALAALGPSAAMWVATTFGTASTGTAISALHGIAATNAALAWLGGGTTAAGAAGIAGGKALLALSGPIGWSIAGAAVGVSSILISRKNRKVAQKALDAAKEITIAGALLAEATAKIQHIEAEISTLNAKLNEYFDKCNVLRNADYASMPEDAKFMLGALVNNTQALSSLLNKAI